MHFSKSLQKSKLAITMRPVSTKLTLLLFLLVYNFLGFRVQILLTNRQETRYKIVKSSCVVLAVNFDLFDFNL